MYRKPGIVGLCLQGRRTLPSQARQLNCFLWYWCDSLCEHFVCYWYHYIQLIVARLRTCIIAVCLQWALMCWVTGLGRLKWWLDSSDRSKMTWLHLTPIHSYENCGMARDLETKFSSQYISHRKNSTSHNLLRTSPQCYKMTTWSIPIIYLLDSISIYVFDIYE